MLKARLRFVVHIRSLSQVFDRPDNAHHEHSDSSGPKLFELQASYRSKRYVHLCLTKILYRILFFQNLIVHQKVRTEQ